MDQRVVQPHAATQCPMPSDGGRTATTGAIAHATLCKGHLQTFVFGKYYPEGAVLQARQNWTFGSIVGQKDVKHSNSLTRHLPSIATEIGIRTFLVPSPLQFNGRVVRPHQLGRCIKLEDTVIKRGRRADGCTLPANTAFAISTGGCAVIVAWLVGDDGRPERVAVAHAGMRSLDRFPEQGHEFFSSSVHSLIRALGVKRGASKAQRVHAYIELPITPAEFVYPPDHKLYGSENVKKLDYFASKYNQLPNMQAIDKASGAIDICAIIKVQFMDFGVPLKNLRRGTPTSALEGLVYTTREANVEERTMRNLVIIAHYE